MQSAEQDLIQYEHPLNERVRTLLRLEHLFQRTAYHQQQRESWDSRAAVDGLLDILNVVSRTDIKSELIKELERHTATLGKIRSAPGVDSGRLQQTLNDLESVSQRLQQMNSQIGRNLRENEFFSAISQRSSIPGGNCAFDLPQYYYWLQRPPGKRQQDLETWSKELLLLKSAVKLLLSLIRGAVNPRRVLARAGFFQHRLESQIPAQLVRVGLPGSSPMYPEISGGRHRFTIRFFEVDEADHPIQTQKDVEFMLTSCII